MGSGKASKTVAESTHVVENLSYSVILSILTLEFDLFLELFFIFSGPKGYFLCRGRVKNLFLYVLTGCYNFSEFLGARKTYKRKNIQFPVRQR